MTMELIHKGAEADLYLEDGCLIKKRNQKKYRIPELDHKLRRQRSKREKKALSRAKRAGVPVPQVYSFDKEECAIEMEYISGSKLRDRIEENPEEYGRQIGKLISRMHEGNVVHNDLTTSNMILREDKIHFIDFGLSIYSEKIEDKAMDLVVLRKALEATHYSIAKKLWKSIISAYEKEKILKRVDEILNRARYT